jgi:hypothetical protein
VTSSWSFILQLSQCCTSNKHKTHKGTFSNPVIAGLLPGVNKIFALLGCYVAYIGSYLPKFRTAYRSHFKGQAVFLDSLNFEVGTIVSPETLLNNCISAPRKNPEKIRSRLVHFKKNLYLAF